MYCSTAPSCVGASTAGPRRVNPRGEMRSYGAGAELMQLWHELPQNQFRIARAMGPTPCTCVPRSIDAGLAHAASEGKRRQCGILPRSYARAQRCRTFFRRNQTPPLAPSHPALHYCMHTCCWLASGGVWLLLAACTAMQTGSIRVWGSDFRGWQMRP